MRMVIALCIALVPMIATAQPAGSAAPTGGSAAPAAGSAAPAAGSDAGSAAPVPVTSEPPQAAAAPSAADLRKTCAAAMNADPKFAEDIVKTINEQTLAQHNAAASAIAKNEKHVVLAYGAFWVLAAGFVVFLWRRQQGLQAEIQQLKRDLEAAKQ